MRYYIICLWCFSISIGCTKQEPLTSFVTSMKDYTKKALPKKLEGKIVFDDAQKISYLFNVKGRYYNAPSYPQYPNPVDFKEKFYWEMVSSNERVRVYIDTNLTEDNFICFKTENVAFPDSVYTFYHYVLPKDSIYSYAYHKYYPVYKLNNIEYSNCYVISGFNKNNKVVGKVIYNYENGFIYFEVANNLKYTINP